MALRTAISSRIPMVIILGATGTGKTKLSVELAQKFRTEIISADSMQIYKGLDVVTAKASAQEREAAPHHLLDLLEPNQFFTVVDFRDRAFKIIDDLILQNKIPIIVGGTNYYIEAIVYKILVQQTSDSDTQSLLWDKSRRKRDLDDVSKYAAANKSKKLAVDPDNSNKEDSLKDTAHETEESNDEKLTQTAVANLKTDNSKESVQKFVDNEKQFTNEEIHSKLAAIDPVMADRLHVNNRRKVLRSIEVWLQSGRAHSEILDEQKLSEGELRKPDATIILWLKCDQEVHDERLDARVDSMLEQGLIRELLDFHDRHNMHRIQDGEPPDYTKGIFQTLGFKEFHEYLILSQENKESESGKQLLKQSIENMKMGTRRYARRQNKVVRARFLEHPRREVPPIYELDTTDLSKWDELVKNKSIHIIENYLKNTTCDYEPLKPNAAAEAKKTLNAHSNHYCEICNRVLIGDKEYAIHMKSNRHSKVVQKRKREQQLPNNQIPELGRII